MIRITSKNTVEDNAKDNTLFFINLGGYKENEFEEYHYKVLTVAKNLASATKKSKTTSFYKHCGFAGAGAVSHIDDKYGVDVDNVYKVADVLDADSKNNFSIHIEPNTSAKTEDTLHIGYLKLQKILH